MKAIYAAEAGDLNELKRLYGKGYELDEICCNGAVTNGHVHILEYLVTLGITPGRLDCCDAAFRGHLHVLEWLNENEYLVKDDIFICKSAAGNGHLDCLKYLHENGCKWDSETTENAALFNNLDCLKYAHENGCPWNYMTYYMAKSEGHTEIVQYLEENGCPQGRPVRTKNRNITSLDWHRDGPFINILSSLPLFNEHIEYKDRSPTSTIKRYAELVMEQCSATFDEAIELLEKNNNDIVAVVFNYKMQHDC